ncbi:MAG: hypothetical protein J6A28_03535 [Clostridia bacterium]|nr:hypothetical protein [Clostridia bacterium]
MNKIEFIYDYTKKEFLRMLDKCDRAIKWKSKKTESYSITKEECEKIYYKLIHKQGKLLNMIKRNYIDGTYIPARPTPHSNHYKDIMRIMNFYHKETISLEDIAKLRQQMETGECEIYNMFYRSQYYPEGEQLYHGRFLEHYNEEEHIL